MAGCGPPFDELDWMNSSVIVQSIQFEMGLDAVSARNVAKQRNHLYFSCNAFFFIKRKNMTSLFLMESTDACIKFAMQK